MPFAYHASNNSKLSEAKPHVSLDARISRLRLVHEHRFDHLDLAGRLLRRRAAALTVAAKAGPEQDDDRHDGAKDVDGSAGGFTFGEDSRI
mmetsp:Transcript_10703/g.32434  ORF Transcript_10703/g.32434 Transcript_10703/m.32434 type:complete len:91 (+) Transcript_10703:1186-1458(+)